MDVDEQNIVLTRKSERTTQHGSKNVQKCNLTIWTTRTPHPTKIKLKKMERTQAFSKRNNSCSANVTRVTNTVMNGHIRGHVWHRYTVTVEVMTSTYPLRTLSSVASTHYQGYHDINHIQVLLEICSITNMLLSCRQGPYQDHFCV